MMSVMESLELAQKAVFFALEKKAEKPLILDVSKLTSFADYFVICEAPSERQTQAIAGNVRDELAKLGKRPIGFEGFEQGSWILCDYGDVIVHVFSDTARLHYNLEGFWNGAPQIPCAS